MTPLDPRLRAAIGELANVLQAATLVARQLRRELGTQVEDVGTLHDALQEAITAIRTLHQEDEP